MTAANRLLLCLWQCRVSIGCLQLPAPPGWGGHKTEITGPRAQLPLSSLLSRLPSSVMLDLRVYLFLLIPFFCLLEGWDARGLPLRSCECPPYFVVSRDFGERDMS